jgi:hypothetical protein
VTECTSSGGGPVIFTVIERRMSASRTTLKETTMNPRIITIAAAAAFTAIGFAAPASATSLGAPVHTIGQTVAQTIAQDGDSQVLLVGKKHGQARQVARQARQVARQEQVARQALRLLPRLPRPLRPL